MVKWVKTWGWTKTSQRFGKKNTPGVGCSTHNPIEPGVYVPFTYLFPKSWPLSLSTPSAVRSSMAAGSSRCRWQRCSGGAGGLMVMVMEASGRLARAGRSTAGGRGARRSTQGGRRGAVSAPGCGRLGRAQGGLQVVAGGRGALVLSVGWRTSGDATWLPALWSEIS